MRVTLKINYASSLRKAHSFNWQLARGTAALLGPASVMAFVLGGWRLGADLNLTGQFAISQGIFSHWQVWFAVGAAMQLVSTALTRYARRHYSGIDGATL
ncbi:MAG: hypothetical protein ABJF23_14710 [Bryobacteraceae bacterium]